MNTTKLLMGLAAAATFLTVPFPLQAAVVKLSGSGICHTASSAYYDRNKSFRPFDGLDACLEYGRLPRGVTRIAADRSEAPQVPNDSGARAPYDRSAFGGWADEDRDCLNTRHELLMSLSTSAIALRPSGCTIDRGRWYDPYTGKTFYNAQDLDIDHLVPLAYAWSRGADRWSDETRRRFANDPANLFAVDAGVNRQKGAAGPTEWLPPKESFQCQYVTRFVRVMKTYKLQPSSRESAEIDALRRTICKK